MWGSHGICPISRCGGLPDCAFTIERRKSQPFFGFAPTALKRLGRAKLFFCPSLSAPTSQLVAHAFSQHRVCYTLSFLHIPTDRHSRFAGTVCNMFLSRIYRLISCTYFTQELA